MYKLFPAAHAMEFSVGCHARWSNFVEKSLEFPLPSAPAFSPPLLTARVKEVSVLVGLVGLAT